MMNQIFSPKLLTLIYKDVCLTIACFINQFKVEFLLTFPGSKKVPEKKHSLGMKKDGIKNKKVEIILAECNNNAPVEKRLKI